MSVGVSLTSSAVAHPQRLDDLVALGRKLRPLTTGVVYPLSIEALMGAVEAGRDGLIDPVLVGPADAIRALAAKENVDLRAWGIVDEPDAEDAAKRACQMAGRGEVQALMKGSLHTDEFLHAVVQKEAGLRTGRLLSHCALIFLPAYGRRIVLSDAAINIAPDLDQKRDICQNAIVLARAIGVDIPEGRRHLGRRDRPVEDAVDIGRGRAGQNGRLPADRRRDHVDGPLDLDGAVDPEAAKIKRINFTGGRPGRRADRSQHRRGERHVQGIPLHGRPRLRAA